MDGEGFGFHENCALMASQAADTPLLIEVTHGHRRRSEVEAFIAERYRRAYGAQVTEFMPTLFAMVSPLGDVISAAGLRRAGEGPLFVEHYLDAPAEVVLEQHFGPPVRRDRIAEIGHLSGLGHGTGRRLFPLLACWLRDHDIDWALFAATGALRQMFERMEVRPRPLAPARKERLGLAADAWGSYYETDPWVVGGPLRLGRRLLERAS